MRVVGAGSIQVEVSLALQVLVEFTKNSDKNVEIRSGIWDTEHAGGGIPRGSRSLQIAQASFQTRLAYNLGNFLRQLVLPREIKRWTLTTTREKLIKIGAKIVRHARRVVFQLAEVAVPRRLFLAILCAIDRLRLPMPAPG